MAKKKTEPTIAQVIRKRRADVIIANGYLSLLLRFAFLALVLWLLFTQVFLLTQVNGNEMYPALEDGDVILAYRLQKDYSKNDVIVYEQNGKLVIGRILGREGDSVRLDDSGNLILNGANQVGEILYPTYAKDGISYPYIVPEDSFFILDDYRTQAEDSRDFGSVGKDQVAGKVITIVRRRGI